MPVTRTKYGESTWARALPAAQRLPALRDTLSDAADVVIIGGGLTAALTAWALAETTPRRRVLVLAPGRIGDGPSALSPGLLTTVTAADYRALEQAQGRRIARALMADALAAPRALAQRLARGRITAPVQARHLWRVVGDGEGPAAERERRTREEAGHPARIVTGPALGRVLRAEIGAALGTGAAGTVDPLRVLAGAVRRARAAGARVAERVPVARIEHHETGTRVHTASRVIAAARVMVCTDAPGAFAPTLARHVRSISRGVVCTEPMAAAMARAVGLGDSVLVRDGVLAACVLPDARLLVTGLDAPLVAPAGRRVRTADDPDVARTGELMYECLRLYPAIMGLRPADGWSVTVTSATDGWPVVGPHRQYPHHLFAFGSDHDPALAFVASQVLTRAVLGTGTAADAAWGFSRVQEARQR